jgi:hypothetical protein
VIGSRSLRHSFQSTHSRLLTRRADDPQKNFEVEFLAEQAALRERGEGWRAERRKPDAKNRESLAKGPEIEQIEPPRTWRERETEERTENDSERL